MSTSTIDGAAYTYDSAGNRTSKTNELSAVTSNYTYDPLYELTQVTQATNTTESYSYDPVGNRLSSQGVSSYTNNSSNMVKLPNESSVPQLLELGGKRVAGM
jgi:YD repeat-containing protein